jgi:hypothetical protein
MKKLMSLMLGLALATSVVTKNKKKKAEDPKK